MDFRPLDLAFVLWFASTTLAGAACRGDDVFPLLEAKSPATYEAIQAAGRTFPFGHGTFFRLTGGARSPSYVFGTLHLADPRVTNFAPHVREALAGAKIVALETVDFGDGLHKALVKDREALTAALLAPADRRADRLLAPEDYALLEKLFERRGLRPAEVGKFKAVVLALLLDLPPCAIRRPRTRPYADELIAIRAKAIGTRVVGLEKLSEQLSILDDLSRETERDLLLATLRQDAHAEDIVETTITRYRAGDIGGLLAWMRSPEPFPGKDAAQTPPAFLDRLVTARNRRMRDRALPLLEQGGAFIAVGAVHLPGEDGLLRLLEDKGFKVELVE